MHNEQGETDNESMMSTVMITMTTVTSCQHDHKEKKNYFHMK